MREQCQTSALVVTVAGVEAGPMVGFIDIAPGAYFHMPVEATFAAMHPQAPKDAPLTAIVDDRLNGTGDVWRFDKSELADQVCFLALREGMGRADRLGEVVIRRPRGSGES